MFAELRVKDMSQNCQYLFWRIGVEGKVDEFSIILSYYFEMSYEI